MFLAMADDIRVVLIKLADRLHNMRTLYALPPDKQTRIARQTLEIYAPLAERLGIWSVKWELEDLAFKTLEPERYRELARMLDTRRKGRESVRPPRHRDVLRPELQAAGIEAELSGRPKHLYSIWKKMQRKGAEIGEIYDVYAIRMLVDEIKDCYAALGVVHSMWRPIPGQFDDYIAVPKPNLYQSLHTAVIALDGQPLEIQIRTHAMHQVSEVGIAAHWRYKEGSRADREYDAKLAWLRQVMDWQRDVSDATEFVEGVKLDVFQDQVFVFTPKGEVKDLPAGATPLDFAYRIHTDVGHRCIGAKVNNRLVPARLQAQERRHRRDRDHQGRARSVARLAEPGPDQPRPGEDPAVVQAPGARREHRPRPRVARARASAPGPDEPRRGGPGPDPGDRQGLQVREPRRLLRRHRLRGDRRPAGRHPAGCRGRCPAGAAADGPAAESVAPGRRPRQGRGGPPGPFRQVLPPHPGRPDHRLHHPRQGRDGPPAELPDRHGRARDGAPDRGRMGEPGPADLPHLHPRSRPTTGRGCCPTSARSWPSTRSTSWRPPSPSRPTERRRSGPRSRSPRSPSWPGS